MNRLHNNIPPLSPKTLVLLKCKSNPPFQDWLVAVILVYDKSNLPNEVITYFLSAFKIPLHLKETIIHNYKKTTQLSSVLR